MLTYSKTYSRKSSKSRTRKIGKFFALGFLAVYSAMLVLSLNPLIILFTVLFNVFVYFLSKCNGVRYPEQISILENQVEFACEDGKVYTFYKSMPVTVWRSGSEAGGTNYFLEQANISVDLDENFDDYKSLTQDLLLMWPDLGNQIN